MLIEDNPGDARLIQELFKETPKLDVHLKIRPTLSEGLEAFLENKFDILLLDLMLPDSFGSNTIALINEKVKDTPIIIISGTEDENLALKSIKIGIQDYLVKGKINSSLLERSILYTLERYRVIEELKASKKKILDMLHRINFYKDMFIHDINNIFQSIVSAVQVCSFEMENSDLNLTSIDMLRIIEKEIFRGSKLVSNVRKLSELEENDLKIYPIYFYPILTKVIADLKNKYSPREINIDVECDFTDHFIWANYFLQDIFENIIHNSIRHNENVIVDITIKVRANDTNDKEFIQLEFIDNGIGIEDSRKETIFLRGSKGDKFNSGLGLGLTLVTKIIKSFKGEIWVEDNVVGDYTKGSKFTLIIPRANSKNIKGDL